MATAKQVNDFINLIAPIIQREYKAHGWGVPSAIIAQAGIESAWGTSKLGSIYDKDSCYNFWGMKYRDGCGTKFKEFKTKEQDAKTGLYYTITARFRKYDTVSDGIDGYFAFIESYARYKPVMYDSPDFRKYALNLKACGWATSLKYSENIINTVEKYNLERYDGNNQTAGTSNNVDVSQFPTLRKGSRGYYVSVLQQSLNYWGVRGGNLVVDSIFGNQVELSVIEFQALHGLKKDGIVGRNTWGVLMKV